MITLPEDLAKQISNIIAPSPIEYIVLLAPQMLYQTFFSHFESLHFYYRSIVGIHQIGARSITMINHLFSG
jgi:hypothetical protein